MSSRCRLTDISSIWVFPKIGVPQNGWFVMDDLGVPPFFGNTHIIDSRFLGSNTGEILVELSREIIVESHHVNPKGCDLWKGRHE